ncbi:hypothetical protein [Streptacidiphilus carbonis]|uniref:hypothetical protein n=1 Tax=Streptacidiphilus carbonis TaxID=105422 RepID=UPI0006946B8A|nr:hypothetical protein [Streptacidiphilus carbonis]
MTTIDLTNTDETPSAATATPNDEQSDVLSGVRDDLLKYSAQGGFTLSAETNAWYAAAGTVATPEDARAASTILAELRGRDLETVREAAEQLDAGTPLSGLDTVAAVAEAFALLLRVRGTLATLAPAAYRSADLDRLSAATASGAERKAQGVKLSWGDRRALAKAARRLAVSKRVRRATLHAAIDAAAAERADWAALAPGTLPALPDDAAVLDSAAPSVETVRTGLVVLGKLLPGQDFAALPFAELAEAVDRLAADEGTLYRLPTLRALRDSIEERGNGDLLAELTDQQADADAVAAACDRAFGLPAEAEPATAPAAAAATATDLLPNPRATDDEAEAEAEVAVEAEVDAEAEAEVEAQVEDAVEVEAEAEAAPVEAEAEVEPEASAEAVEVEVEVEVAQEVAEVEAEAEAASAEVEAEAEVAPVAAPEAEIAAVETVEAVVEPEPATAEVEAEVETAEPEATEPPAAEEPKATKRPRKPAFTPGRPVTAYSADELVSVVRWIDGDGTDRSEDELLRAAMKELGFSRLGPRIKEALGAAIAEARA